MSNGFRGVPLTFEMDTLQREVRRDEQVTVFVFPAARKTQYRAVVANSDANNRILRARR
jgi:hypothetical protein